MPQNKGKGPGQRGAMLPRPARGKARYKSDAKRLEERLRASGYPSSSQIMRDARAAQRRALAEPEEETPSPLDALPNDVLLNMLDKAASGEYNDACDAVTKWCGLDKRRNGLCRDAGDRQWGDMTARIFGPNAPTLVANDPMKNFFALCKREERNRAIERAKSFANGMYKRYEGEEETAFLNAVADIHILTDHGGVETADGRVRLARMVINMIDRFHGGWVDRDTSYYQEELLDEGVPGFMLEGTEEEVDAALDLLIYYAGAFDNEIDFRTGYFPDKIPLLKRLFEAGDAARKEQIVNLWYHLMMDYSKQDYDDKELQGMRDYVYALMDAEVDDLIVEHLKTRPSYSELCGGMLASMAKQIRKAEEESERKFWVLWSENRERREKLQALGH